MSYDDEIAKLQLLQRAELYEITIGDGEILRMTNYERNVTFGGNVYTKRPIESSEHEQELQVDSDEINVTLPLVRFVQEYIENGPIEDITVKIIDFFIDTGFSSVLFVGAVTDISIDIDTGATSLTVQNSSTVLNASFPALPYKAVCPLQTYGVRCGLNKDDFKSTAATTATAKTLSSSALSAQADGYYTNGFAEYTQGGITQRRWITNHVGGIATVLYPFRNFINGAQVSYFAGDDKKRLTCRDKFNNVNNWSGFEYIPNKNPVTEGL